MGGKVLPVQVVDQQLRRHGRVGSEQERQQDRSGEPLRDRDGVSPHPHLEWAQDPELDAIGLRWRHHRPCHGLLPSNERGEQRVTAYAKRWSKRTGAP